MSHGSRRHWSVSLLFALFLISSVAMIELIDYNQKSKLEDELLEEGRKDLASIRSRLEATMLADIYRIHSLTSFVSLNPELTQFNWQTLAASMIQESRHVRIIGLAPNDVIHYIYPLQGNERALGLDYRKVPEQWYSVKKARDIKQIFISGPVPLIQGGQALIVRLPIFTGSADNPVYWGVASMVIDLDGLLEDVGVQDFDQSYHLAIRGRNSLGASGDIFYGDASTFNRAFSVQTVFFPYGTWVIAASEQSNQLSQLPWYQVHLARVVGYPGLVLILIAFVTIYRLYRTANRRSLHDELTHLPNRRYFMFTLQRHFDNALRNKDVQKTFSVLNIDLNQFKAINDQYGHAAGDLVLTQAARRISRSLRSSDVVARIGGDEFLVLLPRISREEDIIAVKNKIQQALCSIPVEYEGHHIPIHVSIGSALYSHEHLTIDDLLKDADQQMYSEKRRSRAA